MSADGSKCTCKMDPSYKYRASISCEGSRCLNRSSKMHAQLVHGVSITPRSCHYPHGVSTVISSTLGCPAHFQALFVELIAQSKRNWSHKEGFSCSSPGVRAITIKVEGQGGGQRLPSYGGILGGTSLQGQQERSFPPGPGNK